MRYSLIHKSLVIAWLFLGLAQAVYAQNITKDSLLTLPVNDVMILKQAEDEQELVSIASRKAQSSREAPGIVTLIEREEILQTGARDLIDVLRLVPGFAFATDVQGTTGIGIRGNWATEGKVLLQLNGIPLNEILYATSYFGNRFPVELIERIEIIRGPGSAIYGGFAELGVINIVTRGSEEFSGLQVSGTYGQMNNGFGRANTSLVFGKQTNELSIDLIAYTGQAQRSNDDFTDFYGDTYSLSGENSRIRPSMINFRTSYKGLQFSFLRENYKENNRTAFFVNTPEIIHYEFINEAINLSYDLKLGEKVELHPELTVLRQSPYKSAEESTYLMDTTDPESYGGLYYNILARRIIASLISNYDPSENFNFSIGGQFIADNANAKNQIGGVYGDGKEVSYQTIALFAQGLWQGEIGNVTVGARFEEHNFFGSAFAPRIAFTRVWDKFHLKLLYSQAFRSPSIENIELAPAEGISPEKTNVLELEAGYRFSKQASITANIFNTTINDAIVYVFDENTGESYENLGKVGTRGFEVEGRYSTEKVKLKASYSFYQVATNTVPLYAVPQTGIFLEEGFSSDELLTGQQLLGLPAHKAAGYLTWQATPILSITPSFTYIGKRYGFYAVDEEDTSLAKAFAPVTLLNLNFRMNRLLIDGLSGSLGVNDILNESYQFIQPYNGYHAPLPGPSREWVLRLMYAF